MALHTGQRSTVEKGPVWASCQLTIRQCVDKTMQIVWMGGEVPAPPLQGKEVQIGWIFTGCSSDW